LILSADVFIYVGDLTEVFALAAQALRPLGLFAYSVELHDGDSYALGPHARYSHSLPYLRHLAAANNLQERWLNEMVLRREGDADVKGWVIVVEKT
jgi:predicted TPR repeat methyltransferase